MNIHPSKGRILLAFVIFLIFLYSLLLMRTAWLCDDAYIAFRTIDNAVNGFGLRWNVIERVQSYTHPLWMFLLTSLYAVTHEIYFTSLITSIVLSIFAALLLVWRISGVRFHAIAGLLILLFSKASMDFSTSGLENPLIFLLIVVFGIVFIREEWSPKKVLLLYLIASLGMVTRMDTALIFSPVLLYALWKMRNLKSVGMAVLGSLPIIAWELFSMIYYGFPFPNTAYAKLNTGIAGADLWMQGGRYFSNSFMNDPLTLIVVCCGIIFPFIVRRKEFFYLSIGILLYCIYIAKIGGDFMSGRFFTPPLYASLVVLMGIGFSSFRFTAASYLGIVVAGMISPHPTVLSTTGYGIEYSASSNDNIYDERGSYYPYTSLEKTIRGSPIARHPWFISGGEAKENKTPLVIRHSIGFFGYAAGPGVYIIDRWSLTDPLLARLPAGSDWHIGHYRRKLPDGYAESVLTDSIVIKDPDLALYYRKLRTIIRGDIWSSERFREIWMMNLGANDHLLDKYRSSLKSGSQARP